MSQSNINKAVNETVNPTIRNSQKIIGSTVGKILQADERSNRCKVEYFDYNTRRSTAVDCMVDLRNGTTGWFPSVGQFVSFLPDNFGSGLVLSRYVGNNYESEIKGNTRLKNDILNNGDPCLCGGIILG